MTNTYTEREVLEMYAIARDLVRGLAELDSCEYFMEGDGNYKNEYARKRPIICRQLLETLERFSELPTKIQEGIAQIERLDMSKVEGRVI
jgi:hypothetical protein